MSMKTVSEYAQKIPQSHTADQLTAPWGKSTGHKEDKQSKATSSLFPIKMIAKLERTHGNVQQNMEKNRTPLWEQQPTTNQQQQNRRLRATLPCYLYGKATENVSIDAFDNNTRLNKKFTSMLNMLGNTNMWPAMRFWVQMRYLVEIEILIFSDTYMSLEYTCEISVRYLKRFLRNRQKKHRSLRHGIVYKVFPTSTLIFW